MGEPDVDPTGDTTPSERPGPEREPTRVDRFELIRRVGAGGMGVVYAAHDPHLDRTIALKLVKSEAASEAARERLVREARAMASVSDPGVVVVFDAGTVDTDVWIAMEYVAGGTLKEWLRERHRPWREVVARFIAAGRGLAAAHAVGVVHRDFKAENVLLGERGRVCVTDFGLAHAVSEGTEIADGSGHRDPERLTSTGMVVGTPAYMSPEAHLGRATDASSDQFSYCVAFWEALYGKRPFSTPEDSDTVLLAAAVIDGRIDEPPGDARVPRWLERILRRGLAVDPAKRWPDLPALLGELERIPRRRRGLALIGGGTAVVGVALVGAIALRPGDDHCKATAAELDGVWSADSAAKVRAKIAAGNHPSAAKIADAVVERLGARADRWRAMRIEVCRSGEPAETAEPRLACLERSKSSLQSAVDELIAHGVLKSALEAATAGIDATDCATDHAQWWRTSKTASPELVRKATELDVLRSDGQWDRVGREGPVLAQQIEESGDLALASRTWWIVARVSTSMPAAAGRKAARRAAELATTIGDDATAARAWGQAATVAAHAKDFDAVDDLLAMGRAAAARVATPDLRLLLDANEASTLIERGKHDAALTICLRVRAEAAKLPGQPTALLRALQCLVDVYMAQQNGDGLVEAATALKVMYVSDYGADHLLVYDTRRVIAEAQFMRGDRAGARKEFAALVAAHEAMFGPKSRSLMDLLSNIAERESDADVDSIDGRIASQRALEIGRAILPANDPQLGRLLYLHGTNTSHVDPDAARALYDEALPIYERLDDKNEWAGLAINSAMLEAETGHCDRAVPRLEKIDQIARTNAIPDMYGAVARAVIGVCEIKSGKVAEGIEKLKASAKALDESQPEFAAEFRMWQAEGEWRRGQTEVARAIAREVRAKLVGDTPNVKGLQKKLDDNFLGTGRKPREPRDLQ